MYWQPTLLKDVAEESLIDKSSQDTIAETFEASLTFSENSSHGNLEIPVHPYMKLIAASEQKLNGWSRWLITMEKCSNFEKDLPCTAPISSSPKDLRHFGDDLFKRLR